ncbi:ATP-dependent helicase, partial [Microbacterium sp. 16-032]
PQGGRSQGQRSGAGRGQGTGGGQRAGAGASRSQGAGRSASGTPTTGMVVGARSPRTNRRAQG